MTEYIINMVFAIAGFFVLLLMNSVIIYSIFLHRTRFTGHLNNFYQRLGMFFIVLFTIQTIFPLYMVMLNFLRMNGLILPADSGTVFFERMYLSLFLLINIASFYLASKILESMDRLVDNYSFIDDKKGHDFAPQARVKKRLRHIYFTPKKKG